LLSLIEVHMGLLRYTHSETKRIESRLGKTAVNWDWNPLITLSRSPMMTLQHRF
jgi:hypothetical protein